MSGAYREKLAGDYAPKSALEALKRKVEKQARSIRELTAAEEARAAAALLREPGDTFVSRTELLDLVETGEVPDAWIPGLPEADPADPATDPAADPAPDPEAVPE